MGWATHDDGWPADLGAGRDLVRDISAVNEVV